MSQPYKVFNSAEFVDRNAEIERVQTISNERKRGTIIFEGARGAGKTSLLLKIYHQFIQQSELSPFLISLSPYSAPEFKTHKNIWIREEKFRSEDISTLLNQLANSLEIEFIQSDDREIQKEYFARGLAYRTANTVPVLLVDSIYECSEDIRLEIEKYILTPILTSERVFLILSGRGKRPIWSRPELQTAEIIDLHPLTEVYVKEQLEKLEQQKKLKWSVNEYKKIADLSGGYPLIVRVIGESKKDLPDALNDAIDIIIQDSLSDNEREEGRYTETRSQIEKLSLVGIPFRIPDVQDYLFPNDPKQRVKTNDLINLLLGSHLLRYEGKGYQLNESIVYPLKKWLMIKQPSEYQPNLNQLKRVSKKLQEEYPSASTWYQQMIPSNHIMTQH